MKVCACPAEVPAPESDYSDGYPFKKMEAAQTEHKEQLKKHLIKLGYDGPLTGEIFMTPHADGNAIYMFADGGKNSCLIHLPYGDGWNAPDVKFLPKKEVIKRMESRKKFHELWNKKPKSE